MRSFVPSRKCRHIAKPSVLILLLGGFAAWLISSAAEPPKESAPAKSARTPWTTSRVVGSPDPPPPFKVVRAFPNLKFEHPLFMARCPGSDRLFVGEQAGVLYSFAEQARRQGRLFFDLRKEIKTIHLTPKRKGGRGGLRAGLPSRLREEPPVLRLLHASRPEERQAKPEGRHAGVAVHRHQDRPAADRPGERGDRPHLSAGRAQRRRPPLRPRRHALHLHGRCRQPEPARPVQHRAGHLRPALVHPADRRGPQGRGQELRRPEGQPVRRHEGSAAGSLGLRLPQSLADELRSPDRRTVRRRRRLGAVGDGPPRREGRQLRLVGDGRAAADQAEEGRADAHPPGPDRTAAHASRAASPAATSTAARSSPNCAAPTSSATGRRDACGPPASRAIAPRRCRRSRGRRCASSPSARTRTASCTSSTTTAARCTRSSATTPTSEEREFPDQAVARPACSPRSRTATPAAGVVPFAVNSRQWQDGATAEHWVAFPGDVVRHALPRRRQADPRQRWTGTISACTSPRTRCWCGPSPCDGRRIETQLLHFDGVDWHAYTFAWRDDQSDADLVPADGAEKRGAATGSRTRVWQFHSRSQCMSCHSNWSEYALAFQPEQLNRPGSDGRNQLVAFTERRTHPPGRKRWQTAAAIRRHLGGEGTQARRPGGCEPAAGSAGPCLPARQLRPLPYRWRRRVGRSAASVLRVASRAMKAVGVRPGPRRFRAAGRPHHQAGRSVREHAVLPHGQVRPRSDAAHRLRTAGRSGAEADRGMDRRHEQGRQAASQCPTADPPEETAGQTRSRL